MHGPCVFDVCDSGGSWIRLTLFPGAIATVKRGTYVRAAASVHPCEVRPGPDERGGPSTKMIAYPAVAGRRHTPTGLCFRELVASLCAGFYDLKWVTGTGGSISIRHGERIFMAPSGVQKERIRPQDVFTLDTTGTPLYSPSAEPPAPALRLSQCAPLFQHAFTKRSAGACIHTHAVAAVMVTLKVGSEFRITHQEMIKGIRGHGFTDTLVVPVIDNTPHERDLADSLAAAMDAYPATNAVLVRRHGVYVWGDTWESAKTQAECYHYLFDVALKMWKLGLDPTLPPSSGVHSNGVGVGAGVGAGAGAGAGGAATPASKKKRRASPPSDPVPPAGRTTPRFVVLDIEGTTTPISFVSDVLFPFAAEQVERHLTDNWTAPEVVADVGALVKQAAEDVAASVPGAVPIDMDAAADVPARVAAVVANVRWQMGADRKTGALKQLQGHIWRAGYADGRLSGTVFDDVPSAMHRWSQAGAKVFIYSSGSREAQQLLFRHSTHGDLTPCISAYFDTTTGPKTAPQSYTSIALSVGAPAANDVLFVTDVLAEADAAAAAGMTVALSMRPGNKPLPAARHPHRQVTTFADL